MRDDLPGVTAQAQDTLRETQILIQALERHWLLRKYAEPVDESLTIAPYQTGPLRGELP